MWCRQVSGEQLDKNDCTDYRTSDLSKSIK